MWRQRQLHAQASRRISGWTSRRSNDVAPSSSSTSSVCAPAISGGTFSPCATLTLQAIHRGNHSFPSRVNSIHTRHFYSHSFTPVRAFSTSSSNNDSNNDSDKSKNVPKSEGTNKQADTEATSVLEPVPDSQSPRVPISSSSSSSAALGEPSTPFANNKIPLGLLTPHRPRSQYYGALESWRAHRGFLSQYILQQNSSSPANGAIISSSPAAAAAPSTTEPPSPSSSVTSERPQAVILPILPYARPLLPGMKTNLRIPRADVAAFLSHLKSHPNEMPKYASVFFRLDTPKAPELHVHSHHSSMQSDAEIIRNSIRNIQKSAQQQQQQQQQQTAKKPEEPSPDSKKEGEDSSSAAPSATKAKESGSALSEDSVREFVNAASDAATVSRSSVVQEASSKFRRKPSSSPSTSATTTAAATTGDANAAADAHPDRASSLREMLQYVHPTGVIVELVGLPTDPSLSGGKASVVALSAEALSQLDAADDHVVVRVLVLHRCGFQSVQIHPAGFWQGRVAIIPEPNFVAQWKEIKKIPVEEQDAALLERKIAAENLDTRTRELHALVTRLVALQRTHEEVINRRSHILWAYDQSRPGSAADHAASVTLADSNALQTILHEQDPAARVEHAIKLVQVDIAIIEKQLQIRSALSQRSLPMRTEALEQQRVNVGKALRKLDEKEPTEEEKEQQAKAAAADAEAAKKAASDKTAGTNTATAGGDASTKSSTTGKASTPKYDPSKSPKEHQVDKWRARLAEKKLPPEVATVFEEEVSKYTASDNDSSSTAHSLRQYIDQLTLLPWGVYSQDKLDLKHAEAVLEKEHYGLQEVKNQIMEIIAVSLIKKKQADKQAALNASSSTAAEKEKETSKDSAAPTESHTSGKILCLVGPPGVGKTSIARSVAHALNRQFHRFSVGGLDDVTEIKGHRRTYMGALPGAIVRALKQTAVSNPVLLIDEIDKMASRGFRGDPAAALLEVLDPEQNNSFMDHYLDVAVDLSRVLFICTANNRENIPGPLRDRMDFIEVSGYTSAEKTAIAQRYLMPALYKVTGVQANDLKIEEEALSDLIRWYCREPGVRNLNKQLERVFRKVALQIARRNAKNKSTTAATTPEAEVVAAAVPAAVNDASSSRISVNSDNLSDYVGQRKFARDRMYEVTPVGVVMGLAYSEMGGSTIFIETMTADSIPSAVAINPAAPDATSPAPASPLPAFGGRGGFFCTGQLGNVMKESCSIAYTVAKRMVSTMAPSQLPWFQSSLLHIHLPHGSTPKDGPSAGISLATSMVSLALQTPVLPDLAMTGELTLTGQVTAIGGLKEKLLAAKRAHLKVVLIPSANLAEIHEIRQSSPEILEGLKICPVKHIKEVIDIAFPQMMPVSNKPNVATKQVHNAHINEHAYE